MNTNVYKLYVVPTKAGLQLVTGRDIAVAVIVAVLMLSGAGISQLAATGTAAEIQEHAEPAEPAPERQSDWVYFPSQYVNQGTEKEEHIQAF